MRVLSLPRRGGKTAAMLAWMRTNPESVCVCFCAAEADRLHGENPDIARTRFLTPDSAKLGLRGRHQIPIGVDNADLVLARFLGVPVDFATVNDLECER